MLALVVRGGVVGEIVLVIMRAIFCATNSNGAADINIMRRVEPVNMIIQSRWVAQTGAHPPCSSPPLCRPLILLLLVVVALVIMLPLLIVGIILLII